MTVMAIVSRFQYVAFCRRRRRSSEERREVRGVQKKPRGTAKAFAEVFPGCVTECSPTKLFLFPRF